jgi:hypothetical protein
LFRYETSLADPGDRARHHAMRIAAKRLRYTLEIAKPAYDTAIDPILAAVKKVQTLLGELRDCDVWLQRLEAFAVAERESVLAHFGNLGPLGRVNLGIEYLRQDRQRQREKSFAELVAYWGELKRVGLWEDLLRLIQPPDDSPASGEPSMPAGQTPAPPHWAEFAATEASESRAPSRRRAQQAGKGAAGNGTSQPVGSDPTSRR